MTHNPQTPFAAFLRGVREFRWNWTWADPARVDEPTALDDAYDLGREWAHRLTLRVFDY